MHIYIHDWYLSDDSLPAVLRLRRKLLNARVAWHRHIALQQITRALTPHCTSRETQQLEQTHHSIALFIAAPAHLVPRYPTTGANTFGTPQQSPTRHTHAHRGRRSLPTIYMYSYRGHASNSAPRRTGVHMLRVRYMRWVPGSYVIVAPSAISSPMMQTIRRTLGRLGFAV